MTINGVAVSPFKFSPWWMALPKGKTHITDCKLRYRHHRHRPQGSQDVRLIDGLWCRPGNVITWEPIMENQ